MSYNLHKGKADVDSTIVLTNPLVNDTSKLENTEDVQPEDMERDQWGGKYDFLITLVGFSVGLGNIWRFPYLCFKNGGGAFLIPYLLMVVVGGVPIFLLEVGFGQISRQGGIQAWKIIPLFQGVGYASTVIVFWLNTYYIIVLAWALFYLWSSFAAVLPWDGCGHEWNTAACYDSFDGNMTSNETVDPAEEFFYHKMLKISDSMDDFGTVRWELAIALAAAWILCYFVIWKGIKVSGKIVYFTALFPYVNLMILLIRGVTLPGADKGLIYYFNPDLSRLGDSQVWIDAGTQVFFSYSIGLGCLMALGSYNHPRSNCLRDTLAFATVNSMTSIIGGIAMFSVLGYMADIMGVGVDEVAKGGPGLVFVAYPRAISQLPIAPLWAILFFLMVAFLGIDSEFVGMEGFITSSMDLFPSIQKKKYGREIYLLCFSCIQYLLGLVMITNGGIYIFQLFDFYSASGMALLTVSFFECIAIAYVFGGKRFLTIITKMIGFKGRSEQAMKIFLVFWYFLTPAMSLGIFLFVVIQYQPLLFNDEVEYPEWGYIIGWFLALSSMLCPIVVAIIRIAMANGTLAQRIKYLLKPQVYIDLSEFGLDDIGTPDMDIQLDPVSSRGDLQTNAI